LRGNPEEKNKCGAGNGVMVTNLERGGSLLARSRFGVLSGRDVAKVTSLTGETPVFRLD
jgi:hypothetical protein